jgi:hypothetical protein
VIDLAAATPEQKALLRTRTQPRTNEYMERLIADGRVRWQGKQQAGLLLGHIEELLFGGAAGGGKSAWLMMAALQYADMPGYNAVLFRRTYVQLSGADGLIELSHEWLDDSDARWHPGDAKWTFPAGGTLWFRHMGDAQAHTNYQGLAFDFVGFDELTQFSESQYTYVAFSRGRRRAGSQIPTRIRATSNPGGIGHEWVRGRFGIYLPDGDTDERRLCERPAWVRAQNGGKGRAFLPSRVIDNPSLDREDYIRRMGNLDSTTRQQLLEGDWDARLPGELFQRAWFDVVDRAPEGTRWVRFWDFAATEASTENPDPDWTAGVKVGRHPNGTWYIGHVLNVRKRPQAVEALVAQTAELDGLAVPVRCERQGVLAPPDLERAARLRRPRRPAAGRQGRPRQARQREGRGATGEDRPRPVEPRVPRPDGRVHHDRRARP